MRNLDLLRHASVCQDAAALKDSAVQTLADANAHNKADCPLIGPCSTGTLLGPDKLNCIPRLAQQVAGFAAAPGGSLEDEMRELRWSSSFAARGCIDPYSKGLAVVAVTHKDEICRQVEAWAVTLLNDLTESNEVRRHNAHCRAHVEFIEGCSDCGFARMVIGDSTEVVRPNGIPQIVPRDKCRCPVLNVGDFCPVHGG